MCESVKLSAKIKVNQEGKVFRFASYIVPNQNSSKVETLEPSLIGCTDSCSEAYDSTIQTLIFCCRNETEQRHIEHASAAFMNDKLCIWSVMWKDFVFIYELETEKLKKLNYQTLQRQIQASNFGHDDGDDDEEDYRNANSSSKMRVASGQVAPQKEEIDEKMVTKVLRFLDGQEKLQNVDDDAQKQDDLIQLKSSNLNWFLRKPLEHDQKIDLSSWMIDQEVSAISCMLTTFKNDKLKLQLDDTERSDQLLQVSSTNKTSLFCLAHRKPAELRLFVGVDGLMNMYRYVDLQLQRVWSRTQPVLWDVIETNPTGSLILHLQAEDWSGEKLEDRLKEQKMTWESQNYPLWKPFSYNDLHLLEQIYEKMKSVDDKECPYKITDSFVSSVYDGQTIFSLFDHKKEYLHMMQELIKKKLHDIDANILDEEEIPVVRQLFRVLQYANKRFLEREKGSTKEIDDDLSKKEKSLLFGSSSDSKQKSKLRIKREDITEPMSTLKRTLNMHAPITDEFMDLLEKSEEIQISDFVDD